MRALRRAYAHAGVSPATVGLVEAHGTGTVAGDRAEVEALSTVFAEAGSSRQAVALGSIKSMIGHTKATAGVAGLVKAALALHNRVLPATIVMETLRNLNKLKRSERVAYGTSGDVSGDKSRVVGYAGMLLG